MRKNTVTYFLVNTVIERLARAEEERAHEAEMRMERELQRMLAENWDFACDTCHNESEPRETQVDARS